MNRQHAYDVSSAAAAYAYNVLPAILEMSGADAFLRLHDLFFTALLAYAEQPGGSERVPEPSEN